MKNLFFYSTILLLVFSACQSTQSSSSRKTVATANILNKEAAVLWQQTAAEYDALCYQAFNIAKIRVDEFLNNDTNDDLAVIMDLDETVLDNSPYNGYLIKNSKEFDSESWKKWVQLANAELVPGALDFIKYAEGKGVEIYYISNRKVANTSYTIQNLSKHGINVNQENLLLSGGSTKKDRRRIVNSMSQPILFIGDNLADFTGEFEEEMGFVRRNETLEKYKTFFSKNFIILPNPMYGDWEKALKFNDPMINEDENATKLKFLNSFE